MLSSRDVAIAATSYVVASTTLVSDCIGWLTFGGDFLWPLLVAFILNLLLCLSVSELSGSFPRCGAIFSFTEAVLSPQRSHRSVGVFAAVVMVGTTLLAAGGEISSGAHSLQQLLGWNLDTRWFVVALILAALAPTLLGLRTTAKTAVVAVVGMLGLRGLFGVVGFLGLSHTGAWSASNLWSAQAGATKSLGSGLGLAFWTFVGVEAVASFAEETRHEASILARGMIWALLLVLATSPLMGLGIAGTSTHVEWARLLQSPAACGGECPHVAVGQAMLGTPGRLIMALSAVVSCYGTVMIGLVAIGRIIHGVARDALSPGRLTASLANTDSRGRLPAATLVWTAVLIAIPPLFAQQVVTWLLPAALVWVLLYLGYHTLVLVDHHRRPLRPRAFRLPTPLVAFAALATAAAVPVIFRQVETLGLLARAVTVLLVAAVVTLVIGVRQSPRGAERAPLR